MAMNVEGYAIYFEPEDYGTMQNEGKQDAARGAPGDSANRHTDAKKGAAGVDPGDSANGHADAKIAEIKRSRMAHAATMLVTNIDDAMMAVVRGANNQRDPQQMWAELKGHFYGTQRTVL